MKISILSRHLWTLKLILIQMKNTEKMKNFPLVHILSLSYSKWLGWRRQGQWQHSSPFNLRARSYFHLRQLPWEPLTPPSKSDVSIRPFTFISVTNKSIYVAKNMQSGLPSEFQDKDYREKPYQNKTNKHPVKQTNKQRTRSLSLTGTFSELGIDSAAPCKSLGHESTCTRDRRWGKTNLKPLSPHAQPGYGQTMLCCLSVIHCWW